MKYQVQENCLTVFLPHELDHHNAEEIRKESDHLIERNHIRYVIFDFAETNFMDSSGIGVIMGRYKRIYTRRLPETYTRGCARTCLQRRSRTLK